MCKDPNHRCTYCHEELQKLIHHGDENLYPNALEAWKTRPLGFNHISVRFGDWKNGTHHTIYLDGKPIDRVFEAVLGEEGWVAKYVEHINAEGKGHLEVHAIHGPKELYGACMEVVYGHVEFRLKPDNARWLAIVERYAGAIFEYERIKERGDADQLCLTTEGSA